MSAGGCSAPTSRHQPSPVCSATHRRHPRAAAAIERKPNDQPTSHGERTVFTLHGFGHRTRTEQQRWDGVTWLVDAATEQVYSTRCHLDRTVEGAGSANESVTEYAYDCDGNFERLWNPNHPSAERTAPATTVYSYDALDRLETVSQPFGSSAINAATSYDYDVQDHLASVTDAEGTVTSYVYSDRDLLTAKISEVSGTVFEKCPSSRSAWHLNRQQHLNRHRARPGQSPLGNAGAARSYR